MNHLPMVIGTDEFPLAELCAARMDGDLYPITTTGNLATAGWLPSDQPITSEARARITGLGAHPRAVAERLSAAWILGATVTAPPKVQLGIPAHDRFAPDFLPGNVYRQIVITEAEIVSWEGGRCTTAVRTAFDLARDDSIPDEEAVRVIRALRQVAEANPNEWVHQFEAKTKIPNKRQGLGRLRQAFLLNEAYSEPFSVKF